MSKPANLPWWLLVGLPTSCFCSWCVFCFFSSWGREVIQLWNTVWMILHVMRRTGMHAWRMALRPCQFLFPRQGSSTLSTITEKTLTAFPLSSINGSMVKRGPLTEDRSDYFELHWSSNVSKEPLKQHFTTQWLSSLEVVFHKKRHTQKKHKTPFPTSQFFTCLLRNVPPLHSVSFTLR